MSLIVAGRFETFQEGERAAQALFARGFVEDDVTLFYVNPPGQHAYYPIGGDTKADEGAKHAKKGAGVGVAVGAAIGAVIGVLIFSVFHLPALVGLIAAGVGAYVGSFAGAMNKTRDKPGTGTEPLTHPNKSERDSGVLLAVHVTPENYAMAKSILTEHGARDVERATGRWQAGRWVDFDPTSVPEAATATPPTDGQARA